MNDIALQTVGLGKRYDGGKTVGIEAVDLQLEQGKLYALVGPSGCGKTTLLHCIGNLEHAYSGSIVYRGTPAKAIRNWPDFRQRFLGFVFQFHHLLPTLTLRENIDAALQLDHTLDAKVREARMDALLEMVGLLSRADALAENVSGGQRQRAAIARAFANRPDLLLADEPTGNVDSATGAMILAYMRRYVEDEHKTILVATHDPEVVAIADEVIAMKDGRIVSSSTVA